MKIFDNKKRGDKFPNQKHNCKLITSFHLTLLLIIINLFSAFANSYPQQNISLDLKQVSISRVFKEIESQSDFRVFYKNDQVNINHRVNIKVKDRSIEQVLKLVLKGTDLNYQIVDKQIVIKQESDDKSQPHNDDGYTVTGKVTDEEGPMVGVTIVIKGTTKGTISNIDGIYSIDVTSLEDILVFSFIGYKSLEIPIGGRTVIDIKMTPDAIQLDEIVAIGYGTKKKADITGSISVVKSDEISQLPIPTIDQALQGKATDVKVTQATGMPGEGVSVRIRGIGTINDNTPLFIIDGIPTKDAFNSLSPADIESISILKDASAASIYGARAANGVILITTKKGTKGKSTIRYETYTGVQVAANLTEMTNKDQYIELYNEAARNDGREEIPPGMIDTLPDTDWWKEIFKPALITNHHVVVSGGSDKSNYLVSGNYFKQDGIIINSGFDRYALKTSINSRLTEKMDMGINLNLSQSTMDVLGSSGDGFKGNGGSVVRYAFFRTPIYPVKDKYGEYIDYYPDYADIFGDGYNPVGFAKKYDWTKNTKRAFGNLYLSREIIKNLSFKTDYGIDLLVLDEKRFNENWGYLGRINNPNSLTQTSEFTNISTWKNILNYKKSLGNHEFDLLLGSEAIKSRSHNQVGNAQGFPDQIDNLRYLDNGTINEKVEGAQNNWALFSLFGRISYSYNHKYYIDATLRRDGSSRFGSNYPYGTFPAASLSWRVDNENFLEDNELISHLKLRLSYGIMGNQEIGNYSFASLMTSGVYYPHSSTPSTGYYLNKHGNENLRWESQNQYNAGIDFGIWDNRLFFYIDYYYKLTEDMLIAPLLPPSSGNADAPYVNIGKVLNRGLEIEMNYKSKINSIKYDIGLVFSNYYNEVLELAEGRSRPAGRIDHGVSATLTEEGYPIGSFYLYEMEGIYQDAADIFTHAYQGPGIEPGDVKFKDISGPDGVPDGVIDQLDKDHVGSPFPDFSAGLSTNVMYKNWSLSFFFEGIYGNKIYWQAAHDIEGFYRAFNLTKRVYDERWTGPGTSNTQPRVSWTGATNNKEPSTRFLFDGSYLRLKNINLAYTFSTEFVQRLKISSLKAYVSAQNLLTFTKYPGLDAEMQTSDNAKEEGDLAVGIDWGTYPSSKIFSIGLNVGF